jgi:hypothetical protein
VQRQRADERVGERIRDLVGLEERRHLRLAAEARHAFGDVEHEIAPPTGDELGRERAHVTDALDVVAGRSQGILERGDRRGGIELGDLVLG